ncbi:FMN-linked oxidoreductase [Cadophora sp. DSE1049]|nr:FMN-linked oxidoreductase [Cadophora sp. DSE1049]
MTANDAVGVKDGDAVMSNGGGETIGEQRKEKLHGRAFYESIGSPKFVLAPMVDQSEFAWRMLSRSFIPPSSQRDLVAYTPMLHARMFSETPKFRDVHFQPFRGSLSSTTPPSPLPPLFLDGNPSFDRPLFVQFCANNPSELLSAAKYVAPFCDAVDLNLGCPQGIARKGKYGAFLQEDQELIYQLINMLHKELDVPVTAKIRILDTREKTLEYAKKVLTAGASILTVHGRTREMKGHKTGLADWSVIRYLREQLPRETVLFANGNILRKEDIDKCLEATGADGVMSAEGNLYDPAIFSEAPPVGEEGREYWRGVDGRGGWRMDAVCRRYMDIIYKYVLEVEPPKRQPLYLPSDPEPESSPTPVVEDPITQPTNGETATKRKASTDQTTNSKSTFKRQKTNGPKKEKSTSPNMLAMQPHLFKLLRPLVAKHHNVRDALARSRAGDIEAFENVLQLVEKACKEGLKEYAASGGESWEVEMRNHARLNAAKVAQNGSVNVESKWKKVESGNGKVKNDKEGEGEGEMDESSIETVRACKRPWWVVQPYVRPLPKEALAKGSLTLSKKEKEALRRMGDPFVDLEKVAGNGVVGGGHVEVERVGDKGKGKGKGEEVEIPKEGLVCG